MNIGNSKFLQYLDRICFVGSILFLSALAAWSIAGRFTALQLPSFLQELLFPVFTAATVGYLTNYLAILLLFRPYKPVKWLCGFQGVLPREQAALAKKMGEEIPAHLLPPEELTDQISTLVCHYLDDLEVQGLPHYIRRRSQMKVFLYIRVACADQLAAANQREELERYAKDKGYEVAAAVAADGISGVHTEGIMNFLLNEAKRQGIGTILARDTSRISRDVSSFMRFERKFRENGIRFEYLSKPDNELPVTPMMEAFETAYKKRRTKNGKRA